jgi:hypothetical protein
MPLVICILVGTDALRPDVLEDNWGQLGTVGNKTSRAERPLQRRLGGQAACILFHSPTVPLLMKPLEMKFLYDEHGVLKHSNSFINHAEQHCNPSGSSAAIFLLIYGVRAQMSSGDFALSSKVEGNRVYHPSLETPPLLLQVFWDLLLSDPHSHKIH